ncbi:MAG: antibiotic biosynthesis monooxygenase family protein [Terriglobales bacterium]
MVARVLEFNVSPDRINDLNAKLDNEVLPILRSQTGFVDGLCLHSKEEAGRVLGISLWRTESDLEGYERDAAPRIAQSLGTILTGAPRSSHYSVDVSTFHNITATQKAA